MPISSAVDPSVRARGLGIKTTVRNLRNARVSQLPQRIAVVGQGAAATAYATTPISTLTQTSLVGGTFGFGSPLHLAALRLWPRDGDGVGNIPVTFYPLAEAGGSVAAAGVIAITGTAITNPFVIVAGGVRTQSFAFTSGDTIATMCTKLAAAVNAVPEMPVIATATATVVNFVAKWKGASGNSILLRVEGKTTAGTVFGITQMAGGSGNPSVQPALDAFGEKWETIIVNCLEPADATAQAAFNAAAIARWGAAIRRPFVAVTGNPAATVSASIAGTSNDAYFGVCQIPLPGSDELPVAIAAAAAARIAVVANNDPARDYAGLSLKGLVPGSDGVQWFSADRALAFAGGSSTVKIRDGVAYLADVITPYRPSWGVPDPAYRYVCDLFKLMTVLYNLSLIFERAEWDGAPLIPDDQPTANGNAKQPKMAKAEVCAMLDSLALAAIISNPDAAKASTYAGISADNPKRLDVATTVQLSGNTNVVSVDLNFGFYYGDDVLVN